MLENLIKNDDFQQKLFNGYPCTNHRRSPWNTLHSYKKVTAVSRPLSKINFEVQFENRTCKYAISNIETVLKSWPKNGTAYTVLSKYKLLIMFGLIMLPTQLNKMYKTARCQS